MGYSTYVDARDVHHTIQNYCSKSNSGCHMLEYMVQVAADIISLFFSFVAVILIAFWNSKWIDMDKYSNILEAQGYDELDAPLSNNSISTAVYSLNTQQ